MYNCKCLGSGNKDHKYRHKCFYWLYFLFWDLSSSFPLELSTTNVIDLDTEKTELNEESLAVYSVSMEILVKLEGPIEVNTMMQVKRRSI